MNIPLLYSHDIFFIHIVPGAPGDITYQILTNTTIQLNWSPPDSPNGRILDYQVIYHGYRVNQTVNGLRSVSWYIAMSYC